MDCVSASVEDAAAGSGLASIRLFGLDANYDEIEEVVALNGTTPVVTTQSFLRVHRVWGVTAGSGATAPVTAAGLINITRTTSGEKMAEIVVGEADTNQATYTIPRNKIGLLTKLNMSVLKGGGSAVSADLHLHEITPEGIQLRITEMGGRNDGTTLATKIWSPPWKLEEKHDIFAEVHPSANSAEASAEFTIILVDV